MVRRSLLLICLSTLTLAACSSKLAGEDQAGGGYGTGFAKGGIPYVTDDRRVHQDLNQTDTPVNPPAPVTPATPAPSPLATKPLRERLREFEISRLNGEAVARFGAKSVTIKVFFINEVTAVFKTDLGGGGSNFTVNSKTGQYTLTGTLRDEKPLRTFGEFILTHTGTGETAKIFYRAYKAGLTVREDSSQRAAAGSALEQQIRALGEGTFAWVNNWAVVRGRAVYLIDIVKVAGGTADAGIGAPIFAFKGESLQTGTEEHPAQAVVGHGDVTLIGNGEDQSAKIFSVKLEDPATHQQREVMVDVEMETTPDERVAVETPHDDLLPEIPPVGDDSGYTSAPTLRPRARPDDLNTEPSATLRPRARPEDLDTRGEAAAAAPAAGSSYLRIDTSQRRTARMIHDFNLNREVPGVKNEIRNYQSSRTTLERFYKYANPFRRMIEVIGRAFDVSPAYAYLTVIESSYFTGGRYSNKENSGVALGIFQFKTATANSVGMRTGGGNADERYYFAPAACGAATYIAELVDSFDDGDTTMAILGYNQGQGGAAAAIYCSLGDTDNRRGCASRINHGMTGSEYARYIRLAKNYNYTYAQIERVAAISAAMRSYVNRKLAIYFISSNMRQYGFSIPSDAPRHYPDNNSVMPPNAIHNSKCRAAVNSL